MADEDKVLDTHYEVALDDEPEPNRDPVYVDVVTKDTTRHPVIPAQWRGTDNVKSTLKRQAATAGHIAAYHAVRSPRYIGLAVVWSVVGVFRLLWRHIRWAWHPELNALLQAAATSAKGKDDLKEGRMLEQQLATRRTARAVMLLAELIALAVVGGVLFAFAPRYVLVLVGAAVVPLLAHYGRPATMPIVTPAVVAPRHRKLSADIVLRAYYAAGLGHPDKPDQQIHFGGPMSRDARNIGSEVIIDLPYGKGWSDMIKPGTKSAIASGIDVTEYQVFFTRDKTSDRRHKLLVADQNPLAIPAGRTPLLRLKPTDIWKPAPFGLDERGNPVSVPLMWNSVLVGAQPRKGKTFSARLLALYAALDPYVKLTIVDGKKSPDWSSFRLVAHRYIRGTTVNRDGDPVEQVIDALMEIKKHIGEVNDFLTKLPVDECPEGKITPDLSRKYPQLRVWVLVMEEFQMYYELDDKEASETIASLLSNIMATGPSAGVIPLSSSQKPSGIGASQNVLRLFTRYRDNHSIRFALKCGNRTVSEAILGDEAYGEGYNAAALPEGKEFRGVGILYGADDNTPIVRTHLAEGPDAEKILMAARSFREAAGLLTGEAAGEDMAREARDVLNDVRNVFYAGKATISWPALAARLKEAYPEAYADITPEAISAMVRKLGVKGKSVKDPEFFDKGVGQGCDKASVEAAIERRALSSR
ncbi:cell division protein FtsK [Micromonospora chalcea]